MTHQEWCIVQLKHSESVCDWIAAHNVDNGGLKLFDAIALWLGILKFFWSMSYDLKLHTWREACYSPTETELLNLRIELVVGSIFFTFITLCGWLGIEYSFIFFAVLVVLGLVAWITSPIVLKVIKK